MSGSSSTRRRSSSSSHRPPSPLFHQHHGHHQGTGILQHPSVARLLGIPGDTGGQGNNMAVAPQPILLHSSTRTRPHSDLHRAAASPSGHEKRGESGGALPVPHNRRLHSGRLTHSNGRAGCRAASASPRPTTPDLATQNRRYPPSSHDEHRSQRGVYNQSDAVSVGGSGWRAQEEEAGRPSSSRAAAAPTASSAARAATRKEDFLREMGLLTGEQKGNQSPYQRLRSGGEPPPSNTAKQRASPRPSRGTAQEAHPSRSRSHRTESARLGKSAMHARSSREGIATSEAQPSFVRQMAAGDRGVDWSAHPRSSGRVSTSTRGFEAVDAARETHREGTAVPTERAQRRTVARFLASQHVGRAETLAAEVAAMLAVLSDKKAGYVAQLQAVHQLNSALHQAHSLAEAEQLGVMAATPQIVGTLIEMCTSGEPHSYIALNALHFVAFCPEGCRLMVSLDVMEALLGILRAGEIVEEELRHAALSLLVTVSSTAEGISRSAGMKAVESVILKFLASADRATRCEAHELLKAQLSDAKGLRVFCANARVLPLLERHLQMEPEGSAEQRSARDTIGYIGTVRQYCARPEAADG